MMVKIKLKKQFALSAAKVFGLFIGLQFLIALLIFIANKFKTLSVPAGDLAAILFGLLTMLTYIFFAYKIAARQLEKSMLSPNKFAASVVGVTILAEILVVISLIITEPLLNGLTSSDQQQPSPEIYQEEPMSAVSLIIVTILFSILPYAGLKLVYFYFARKRAIEAKKELFS